MKKVSLTCSLAIALTCSTSFAAVRITEVASTSGAPAGTLSGLDWWELTNTGPGSVSLDGYAWEDSPVENVRSTFPNGVTVDVGQSIIIHQGTNAAIPADFRTAWNLPASVVVLTESQFTGANMFSGLSSGGDEVNLFNAASVLVHGVAFGASTSGVTFEWDRSGASLGLSVAGQNGAVTSTYGGVGSPGTSVIPEPATLALAGCALLGALQLVRRHCR
jgi:hypothetical protein